MKTKAKKLRRMMTDAEIKLWRILRNRKFYNYKFRRQYWLGNHIVDFVSLENKLIIELDGSQHLDSQEYDEKRSQSLRKSGFTILRFWNDQVFNELSAVLETIYLNLIDPPSSALRAPSPASGRREYVRKSYF